MTLITPAYQLISDSGTSQGSKLIDLSTGKELKHITSISMHLRVDEPVRAEVGLLNVVTDGAEIAYASFLIFDPITGQQHSVRRIEYEDGSGLEVVDGQLMHFNA